MSRLSPAECASAKDPAIDACLDSYRADFDSFVEVEMRNLISIASKTKPTRTKHTQNTICGASAELPASLPPPAIFLRKGQYRRKKFYSAKCGK
jgi:hypothetical protein